MLQKHNYVNVDINNVNMGTYLHLFSYHDRYD